MLRRYIVLIIMICLPMIVAYGKNNEIPNKQVQNIPVNKKAQWIQEALSSIANGKYKDVRAIAWWNENFEDTNLRIDSSQESLIAYQKGVSVPVFISTGIFSSNKLRIPVNGTIYHAANPDFGSTEDKVSAESIHEFEKLAKKNIVWAYFSNNWYDDIKFPALEVEIIHHSGKIPFIRMMPRSNFTEGGPDPVYTMQNVIDGDFDIELTQWALDAKNTGIPLLLEFGCEVNGNWFPWNGEYNGGGEKDTYGDPIKADGPERFRDAYRHIINIFRKNDVNNITWFFHVNAYGEPKEQWNEISQYYPGDEYIDWLGISVYGPQVKDEIYQSFTEIMDDIYPVIKRISKNPIAILEFGITELK